MFINSLPDRAEPFSFSITMWSDLPSDLLAKIFSYLSPDSLARARSTCRHWHAGAKAYLLTTIPPVPCDEPPWFLAMPMMRNHRLSCYAHNPVHNNWHALSLHFLPDPVRLVGPIGSLVLIRPTNSTFLQLAICNPFSRQFRHLPLLNTTRTNPAVGVLVPDSSQDVPFPHFKVYVAGGMSEAPRGGAMYEPTLEMYDSRHERWQIVGSMPVEFAVRLTVWTPNESVYSKGFLYWITSARAYCVMGFEIGTNTWRELNVPMADRLEFATLVRRNGLLTLVGGTCGQPACIWELGEGDDWGLVEKMPAELGMRFLGGKGSWCSTKCVGSDEAIYLYRSLGSGMAVWREVVDKGRWEWFWVEGCCSIGGKRVHSFPIKGVLLHPSLASSSIF